MTALLPWRVRGKPHRVMLFVDGENLAIRYGNMLGDKELPDHVHFKKDEYVWSDVLNAALELYEMSRSHYYTSAIGTDDVREIVEDTLRSFRMDAPRVFQRFKGRGSKRVDISLTTEFLMHAFRDNYDIAILVSGDEDFVPAVEAVADHGKMIVLWALPDGLSPALRRAVHHYFDLSKVLLTDKPAAWATVFHDKPL